MPAACSVEDVQRVAESAIEMRSGEPVQMPHWLTVESSLLDRDQAVAVDYCRSWQAVSRSNLNLRSDPADGRCDRSACHPLEYRDGSVPGKNVYRSPTGRGPQIGPEDVLSGCHCGTVSAARRCDASSRAASDG